MWQEEGEEQGVHRSQGPPVEGPKHISKLVSWTRGVREPNSGQKQHGGGC